jgi:hypothetical protein
MNEECWRKENQNVAFLIHTLGKVVMFSKLSASTCVLSMFVLVNLIFTASVKAQTYGPGQGGSGNMMGEGWGMGWGMWGFGWFGVVAICLLALGVIVIAFRLQK